MKLSKWLVMSLRGVAEAISSGSPRANKLALAMTLCITFNFLLSTCLYSQTNPEVYFNSGIDKYVKGDYDGAIALFEQTLSENPVHQKAKNFLVKVLIEATEKQILVSNFQKAKIYIDRAKIVAPDNEKVNELQKVISGGYAKKEDQKQKTVVSAEPKPSPIKKTEPKKRVKAQPVVVKNPDVSSEYEGKSGRNFILLSVIFVIIIFILIFLRIKKKNVENAKRIEEFKKQIQLEEEKKYKKELEKIKLEFHFVQEKTKKELAENIKIQIAEKKAITKKDAEVAHGEFDLAKDEEKILCDAKGRMKRDEYSKEIIKKMTLSIRTIMNVNKNDALNNIKRLSKNENARLRYDCVKIIENVLTPETLKILIDMLDDSDYEVKRAVIMFLGNIGKLHLLEIPLNMLSEVQKRLAEEKLKNGWVI